MAVKTLALRLDLDSGSFTVKMRDAAGAMKTLSSTAHTTNAAIEKTGAHAKKAEGALDGLNRAAFKLQTTLWNVTFLFGGLTFGLIKTNAEAQKTLMLLEGLSKEMDQLARRKDAADSFKWLMDFSKNAPFSLSALTDSFVKFRTAGLDPMDGSMKALVDSVAAFGGNEDTLHRAAIAIQQMAGKGVISMEELRQQLGEAVPTAMRMMAQGMGVTMAQLAKAVGDGKVKAEPALQAMMIQMERTFGGSSQRMMNTFSGQVSKSKTALQQLALAVGGLNADGTYQRGGFMDTLTNGAKDLNKWLANPDTIRGAQELGRNLAILIQKSAEFAKWVTAHTDLLIKLGKAFIVWKSVQLFSGALKVAATATIAAANACKVFAWSVALAGGGTRAATAALMGMAGGASAAGLATRALAGAVTLFRTAVTVLTGPIGWLLGALALVAAAVWKNVTAYQELRKAQDRALRGTATQNDLNTLEAREKELAMNEQGWSEGARRGDYRSQKKMEELSKIRGQVRDLKARLMADQYQAGRNDWAGVTDTAMDKSGVQREYDLKMQMAQAARDKGDAAKALKLTQEANAMYVRAKEAAMANLEDRANDNVRRRTLAFNAAKGTDKETQALKDLRFAEGARDQLAKDLDFERRRLATEQETMNGDPNRFYQNNTKAGKKAAKTEAEKKLEQAIKKISDAREGAFEQSLAARDAMEIMRSNALGASGDVEKFSRKLQATREELVQLLPANDATNKKLAEFDEIAKQATENFRIATMADEMRKLKDETIELGMVSENRFSRAWDGYSKEIALLKTQEGEINKITDAKIRGEQMDVLRANRSAVTQGAIRTIMEGLDEERRSIEEGLMTADKARQAAYEREVERIMKLTDITKVAVEERAQYEEQFAKQRAAMLKALEDQRARDMETPMQRQVREWQDVNERMKELQGAWMNDFADKLVSGQLSFGKFAKRVLADYLQMVARARMASMVEGIIGGIGNMLMSSFGGALGGMFGGSSVIAQPAPGMIAGLRSMPQPTFHTGGIGGYPRDFRMVDPAVFINAQKFHRGRAPQLGSHEMAAIIRKDEGVFTPEQMRALGNGRSSTPNISVNVINESGIAMDAQQQGGRFDGERYVVDVLVDAMSRPGRARNAVMGMK